MTKIVVTFLGLLLLAVHISRPVDAQNTTAMSNVENSTAPATNNGSTAVTDASSGSINTTATGAGFAPQSSALSLLLPVSIVGLLLHGRC